MLAITGAGISTESGIPTFRGKEGYWRNLDPTKLATPEAFERDPSLVWEWYLERRKWIGQAEPNPAHRAIVDLAEKANEFLLVTQNVDDLHARAGLPAAKMVQIHGDIFETRCSQCDGRAELRDANSSRLAGARPSKSREQEGDHRQSSLRDASNTDLPKCPRCQAPMRPGVVWFGEQLDPRKIDIVENFISRACDLTVVIGTTALFGYIIDWATRAGGKLIEVNPDETPLSQFATETIREPAAIALPRLVEQLLA